MGSCPHSVVVVSFVLLSVCVVRRPGERVMSAEFWMDSVRCFDAIADLRTATPAELSAEAAAIGDAASDDVLHHLGSLVERSVSGVAAAMYALADEATLTALAVIDADNR